MAPARLLPPCSKIAMQIHLYPWSPHIEFCKPHHFQLLSIPHADCHAARGYLRFACWEIGYANFCRLLLCSQLHIRCSVEVGLYGGGAPPGRPFLFSLTAWNVPSYPTWMPHLINTTSRPACNPTICIYLLPIQPACPSAHHLTPSTIFPLRRGVPKMPYNSHRLDA
jgi:hypothetical protein